MGSRKWWLVISALVVTAVATNINRFDQHEYDGFDEEDGFDEFDLPESDNVTELGGRKGKIRKYLTSLHFIILSRFFFV